MTAYSATKYTAKSTPDGHVVDPTCGATNGRHGVYSAHRYENCTCPGPSFDKHRAQRDAENAKRRARKDAAKQQKTAVVARMTPTGASTLRRLSADEAERTNRRPAYREAGEAERRFRARDDKACIDANPDLFDLAGSGAGADAQLRKARAWCDACPARNDCLEAALERGEQWTIAAGYSPRELEKMRRAQGVAA